MKISQNEYSILRLNIYTQECQNIVLNTTNRLSSMTAGNHDVNLIKVQFNDQQYIVTSNVNRYKPKFSKIVNQQLNIDKKQQETEDFSSIIHITYNQFQDSSVPNTKRQRRQPSYIDYVKKFYQHTKSRTHMRTLQNLQIDVRNDQNQQYDNIVFTKQCDVYFKPDPSRIKKREVLNIIDDDVNLCPPQYNKQHMMHLASVEKNKHAKLFQKM